MTNTAVTGATFDIDSGQRLARDVRSLPRTPQSAYTALVSNQNMVPVPAP